MVSNIIGNYLIREGLITKEQLKDILREQVRVRAKLGLIAVSEGILSYEEVEALSAGTDSARAFAERAVEMGYLSEGQIKALLRKQGNSYLTFAQTLENQHLMNIEQLEHYLLDFRDNNELTMVDLEDLKSDDPDRILPMYFPMNAPPSFINASCVAVRTMIRSVDYRIAPQKAFFTARFEAANGVIQFTEGEKNFSFAIVGKGQELAMLASRYMHEQFDEVDEDSLDVVGEIVNCISGLYATELSQEGIILDLLPPQHYEQMNAIESEEMCVLPLEINDQTFYFISNIMNLVKIS